MLKCYTKLSDEDFHILYHISCIICDYYPFVGTDWNNYIFLSNQNGNLIKDNIRFNKRF